MGVLRFDLTALAETKTKAEKKAAFDAKKNFFSKVRRGLAQGSWCTCSCTCCVLNVERPSLSFLPGQCMRLCASHSSIGWGVVCVAPATSHHGAHPAAPPQPAAGDGSSSW